MKPALFEYVMPQTVAEALEVLAERGSEAKVLAGGQSLVPLMNFRLARPEYLIDINGLTDLSYLRQADGGIAIGAVTRQSELLRSSLVKERCPLLAYATRFISHPAIRNRGTVGGSVAHADPSAELPGLF
ncbi:MAG: FAD binding domain-containing protein, partial [Chloroflexota bacterium]